MEEKPVKPKGRDKRYKFLKRNEGFFKKAHEFCLLTGTQLIVISPDIREGGYNVFHSIDNEKVKEAFKEIPLPLKIKSKGDPKIGQQSPFPKKKESSLSKLSIPEKLIRFPECYSPSVSSGTTSAEQEIDNFQQFLSFPTSTSDQNGEITVKEESEEFPIKSDYWVNVSRLLPRLRPFDEEKEYKGLYKSTTITPKKVHLNN